MLLGLTPIFVILMIVTLLVKNKTAFLVTNTTLTACALAGVLLYSVLPTGINSHSSWKYKYQKAYINRYSNATDCFPDSIPKDVSDYYFHHTPPMLQGDGDTNLRFKASPDVIKAIEDKYAPIAMSTSQMDNDYASRMYNGDGFWMDTEATIYNLKDTGNFNHQHHSHLIVSKDHTKIEFYAIV